jgi:O-antigen/teichoic acid export membrane protein
VTEGAVAIGTLCSQACVYLLNIVATRTLGPAEYGELASLLTLTVIMSIPAMALQSWTARTTAQGADARSLLGTTIGLSIASSVTTFVLVLAIAPHLGTAAVPGAASAALLVCPLVWLSTALGLLQGGNRLIRLAAVLLAAGLGRLIGGVAGLWLGVGPWSVVWGIGLVTVAVAGLGWAMVLADSPGSTRRTSFLPVLRIAVATGGMWTLANMDVLVARLILDPHSSGWYAAGALVTRAVQFAPQFVVLSAFASLTDAERSRRVLRIALAKVIAIGLFATTVLAAVGPWLVPKVLGSDFAEVGDHAWLFALIGTLLALSQLLVAQRVARHDERVAWGVWSAVAVLIIAVNLTAVSSFLGVATVVLVVNGCLGLGLGLRAALRH